MKKCFLLLITLLFFYPAVAGAGEALPDLAMLPGIAGAMSPGCVASEAGTEISCADGYDNDCDGQTDGADPDCGGGGGQNYSDDFNRADSDNPGAGWTEVTGDWDVVSNALVFVNAVNQTYGVISYANASDTVEQYIKTTIASWGGGGGEQYNQLTAIMRYDDGAGTYYKVLSNQTETVWYDDNGEVQRDNLAFADGDSRSVVVTGTGDDAVIGIWKNTVNDTPYSYGPNCINTALPCWDDANDAPDLAFTDNPTAPADTGKVIAIQMYESTSASGGDVTIDNFFFGDCPQ